MKTDTRKRLGVLFFGLALFAGLALFFYGKQLLPSETHVLPHSGAGYAVITTVSFSSWLLIPISLLAAGTFLLCRRTVTPPPLPPH